MFLGIYPFCPGCPICRYIVVYIVAHNIFLQSFVFLWCHLLFLLFHFWFYLFGFSLSFFLMCLFKGLSILFIFSKNHLLDSLIFCILFLKTVFCLFLLWALLFTSFYSLWSLFVVLFQAPLSVKLDCLYEIFLMFWDSPVMLWISLLGLLSQCTTDFGLLCPHFHLFQGIFWFLLWSHC